MNSPVLVVSLWVVLFTLTLADEPPIPKGRRLRDIVAENYGNESVYIGGTTGWSKLERGSGIVLDREFGYVTPENDFKQSTVHPRPGVWNWEKADAWVKRCAKSDQVLRLHGPIGPQVSNWAKEDSRTPDELKRNLEEFLTELCQRYNKARHVKWLDVVNETAQPDGHWFGPKPGTDQWENPWSKIGFDNRHPLRPPLYIKLAFQIADRHAPNIKLIINQHAGMEEPMWERVKAVVRYLREQGLRVDGIGWQAHIDVGWEKELGNVQRLRALIDWAHANKLSFHVTEANVWLKKQKDYEAQSETFAAILKVLLEKRRSGVVTWNVWNLSDADQWAKTREFKGCIFFDDFRPKPAYYAIQRVLANPPVAARH